VTSKAANDFWRAFCVEADTLTAMIVAGHLRGAFQRVESLLQEHGFDYCFELTHEGCETVLVLTPEGDHEQAQCIDHLVEAKPELSGWRVYGRRQRKTLEDAFAFVRHIYNLDVSDATFDLRETPEGYKITMYSKAMRGLTAQEAYGLVATFLDHAVGENVVMARVIGFSAQEGVGRLSAAALVSALIGQ